MAENIKITLFGAAGRMGRAVIEALDKEDDISIIHAVDIQENSGQKILDFTIEPDSTDTDFGADVWVDVSLTESAYNHSLLAEQNNIPILIGATGFSDEQMKRLQDLNTAHIIAPNLSIGVNLLFELAPEAKKILGNKYDVAVTDIHHRHKKDSPSGTAKKFVDVLSDNDNPGENIQVTSLRVGEVVGEHRILFASAGEEIELVHRARSRLAFAQGVAPAVRFLAGKSTGNYSMAEALGLIK